MLMAGNYAPGIRYKVKCPYCDEIKESGGIKTHIWHKHRDYYDKDKYSKLLEGNYYKQDLIVFPPKEAKAIPNMGAAKQEEANASTKSQGNAMATPENPVGASQALTPTKKPTNLEITEVKPMAGKPEAQQVQQEDDFGCQRCGVTWKGFKPRCPKCNAELEYTQEE